MYFPIYKPTKEYIITFHFVKQNYLKFKMKVFTIFEVIFVSNIFGSH